MLFIFLSFVFWRVFDFIIAFFAPKFIPYFGHFSYQKDLAAIKLPQFIKAFSNFDGLFYIRIAEKGYSQFEQAFFPLYSLFIKGLSPFFAGNSLITGLLISNLAFLLSLFIFKKYLDRLFKNTKLTTWVILFILLFPTSFFFGSLYTESLFFLFFISSLYLLDKKKYFFASFFAIFASLTRFIGVFLFIPFLIYTLNGQLKGFSKKIRALIFTLSPFLGVGIYGLYLFFTTGNFFDFFTSQEAFSAGRSTKLILFPQVIYRYLKIFLTADKNFLYFVSSLEFIIFAVFFVIISFQIYLLIKNKVKNLPLLSISLFSFVNILTPTFTGTFLSIPRFALTSVSFFIFIALIKSDLIKTFIALLFIIFHILLLTLFTQGYFIA